MGKKEERVIEKMEEKLDFEGSEERTYYEKLDYEQLLMRQMDKVRSAGSVEMRGGYKDLKQDGRGNITEVYHPNTREVYVNSVQALHLLLLPKADKKYLEAYRKLKKEQEKKQQEYIEGVKDWKKKHTSHHHEIARTYAEKINIEQMMLINRIGLLGSENMREAE